MSASVLPLALNERDEAMALEYGRPRDVATAVPAAALPVPVTHLREVSLAGFMAADPASIGYAIHPILPRGVVALFGGHGGAGKSTAALTLMAHGACGESWLGFHPDGMIRSVYASLEDPGDLVRYRLRRIAETFNLDPRKIEANLRVLDCTGADATLAAETNDFGVRGLITTRLFDEMSEAATGTDAIVVDNASDAFSGNENERRGVRAFMRLLADLARRHDAAVLLLAHIDKAAARAGSAGNSYSGSTAWHNSARSRVALLVQEDESVLLVHEKLNLGKKADAARLQWNDRGVLVEVDRGAFSLPAADDTSSALAVLLAAQKDGIRVPTNTAGPSTSWHAVQHLPEMVAFADKRGRVRFHAALAQLHRAGDLERDSFKDQHRNVREQWQLTQTGLTRASTSGLRECVSPPIPPLPTHAPVGRCVGREKQPTNATNATNAARDDD